MSGEQFLKGAAVLSIAGLISKVLGAVYRIPLARLIGGEGVGLYQMAYPIYTMMLAVSTAGIPVAISILVAERKARGDEVGARRVFRVSLLLLTFTGALFSLIIFQGAYYLAVKVLYDERAFYAVVTVSPAIFFTALASAFRGYFQGHQSMTPTAVSQVVEQMVRVSTVLVAAYLLLPYGVEFAAAGATFGAVTGSAAALSVLLLIYASYRYRHRGRKKPNRFIAQEPVMRLVLRIAAIALPLSFSGLVMPVIQVIDATIVPLRLQAAGFSMARATELFGQFSGMATTLINLPTIVTVSLAMSLVPAISEAAARRQRGLIGSRIAQALRITMLLVLPAACGLWVLATPIATLLYGIPEVGISLEVLAPAAVLLGLYQTTSGALQGLGQTYIPVRNLIIGASVKVLGNYYLTAMPQLEIRGAGIATLAGFFVALLLNFITLKRATGFPVRVVESLLKPVFAVTIMTAVVKKVHHVLTVALGSQPATVIAVAVGAFVYLTALLLLGSIREKDLKMIPGVGRPIAKFLNKVGLVR